MKEIALNKVTIVAEAATNHSGDIHVAIDMIHAAKEAGADMIKFQSWQIKNMSPDNPAYEMMKSKELSDQAHHDLKDECNLVGIKFITTCFDIGRIDFLSSIGIDTIKVASTDVASIAMLNKLRNRFKMIFLSTGISYPNEVEKAVEVLKTGKFHLLHCVGLYPTPPEKANLARINWLRRFTPSVGYSDHTLGNTAIKIAIGMDAKVIEKHFTLKRDPDNVFSNMSALPKDIKEICDFAQEYEKMIGIEEPKLSREEKDARKLYIGRWGDNR